MKCTTFCRLGICVHSFPSSSAGKAMACWPAPQAMASVILGKHSFALQTGLQTLFTGNHSGLCRSNQQFSLTFCLANHTNTPSSHSNFRTFSFPGTSRPASCSEHTLSNCCISCDDVHGQLKLCQRSRPAALQLRRPAPCWGPCSSSVCTAGRGNGCLGSPRMDQKSYRPSAWHCTIPEVLNNTFQQLFDGFDETRPCTHNTATNCVLLPP